MIQRLFNAPSPEFTKWELFRCTLYYLETIHGTPWYNVDLLGLWLRVSREVRTYRENPEAWHAAKWEKLEAESKAAALPDRDYSCGAACCDDPACNLHGPTDADGNLLYWANKCTQPPPGWECTRTDLPHDGPCAAVPISEPCNGCGKVHQGWSTIRKDLHKQCPTCGAKPGDFCIMLSVDVPLLSYKVGDIRTFSHEERGPE